MTRHADNLFPEDAPAVQFRFGPALPPPEPKEAAPKRTGCTAPMVEFSKDDPLDQRILKRLEAAPGNFIRKDVLAVAVRWNRADVLAAVARLVDDGLLEEYREYHGTGAKRRPARMLRKV